VIAARDAEKSARVQREIEALGRACLSVSCDVTDPAAIRAAVQATLDRFDRLTVLVNNAGVARGGPPETIAEEDWDLVLDTNLKASFLFAQAAHPALRAAGGGKVINIGSEFSLFGSPAVLPYAASKGGVIQLTKSLAVAWARHNIQVNAIIPGWITTELTAPIQDDRRANIIGRTPARRFGEPEELAGAAVFLASHASDFVTGQSIVVDGGYSIA